MCYIIQIYFFQMANIYNLTFNQSTDSCKTQL